MPTNADNDQTPHIETTPAQSVDSSLDHIGLLMIELLAEESDTAGRRRRNELRRRIKAALASSQER
jgi:hypothetical protein